MSLWKFAKWIFFKVDAELAHRFVLRLIQLGEGCGGVPLRIISGSSKVKSLPSEQIFGLEFKSRLGLAAGFDKNAEILTALPALGFGFAEIGTVTPRPQAGNERPRLFRDASREALFNRMGFNNLGAEIVSKRISIAKENLPQHFRVGVNIGKNKDTPLEMAWEDYKKAAAAFNGLADYLVINVSSPNTPGLRSLQSFEALKPIVSEVANVIAGWKETVPLLLKFAPELTGPELTHLVQGVEPLGIAGWIVTNTWAGTFKLGSQELQGGWSGKVLAEAAHRSLKEIRQVSQKPIISVGGISSVDEALKRLDAGAQLIQIYSGWVFQGPSFPAKIAEALKMQKPQAET